MFVFAHLYHVALVLAYTLFTYAFCNAYIDFDFKTFFVENLNLCPVAATVYWMSFLFKRTEFSYICKSGRNAIMHPLMRTKLDHI